MMPEELNMNLKTVQQILTDDLRMKKIFGKKNAVENEEFLSLRDIMHVLFSVQSIAGVTYLTSQRDRHLRIHRTCQPTISGEREKKKSVWRRRPEL